MHSKLFRPQRITISTNQSQPPRNMATPAKSMPSNTPQANNRTFPSGPRVPPKAPLEEITCYACNKKGHYRGSKECPKTPSLACLHIMDVNADKEEPQAPETEETPFEGVDYDGKTDLETPVTDYEGEEEGVGAIIASIHAGDNISDDKILEDSESILQLAALAASDSKEDETVADKIIQSVKEDYELQGSGIVPRPRGPMSKQLQAESQKKHALRSSVECSRPEECTHPFEDRRGMSAIIKINGVDALTCWDAGSQLECISPDFARAVGLQPTPKSKSIKIQLGTKGSSSATLYEVTPQIEAANLKVNH
jgi:hypothetical protein